MVRRQHGASQCRNHLQTVLAPVLAVEGDLSWRWMENKEQLCKLYGVTLWEMPSHFPLVNVLDAVSKEDWAPLPHRVRHDAQALAASQALLSRGTADPGCSGGAGAEGSFLGLWTLTCLLSLPASHVPTLTNIQHVYIDCITLLLRTLPRLSPLPSG